MKVRVDPELCTGDEICTQVCPEIFEMQGDKAVAKIEEVLEDLKDLEKKRLTLVLPRLLL
jgi:ferredoxin